RSRADHGPQAVHPRHRERQGSPVEQGGARAAREARSRGKMTRPFAIAIRSVASLGVLAIAVGAAVPAVLLAGCAEPAFSAHVRDNSLDDIKRALAVSRDAPKGPMNGRPTAYLLTGEKGDRHLVSYDLEGAKINWDVPAEVSSRVAVGRGFV